MMILVRLQGGFFMRILRDWLGRKMRLAVLLVVLFAVCVCSVSIGMDYWREWHTPPQQRVEEALMYALEAPMYCYTSEAVRIHESDMQVITRLAGEKHGENVHLYGTADVLDTEIDVYQIGDCFYRKDIVNDCWMQMTGQNLEATVYLMQEIDPLRCLVLKETMQVTALGKEKVNGMRCYKYQVQSSGTNTFLTSAWNEYYYTVWLDKKHCLQKVEVIADNHESSTEQLRLTVQFDWKAEVPEIKAPI